MKSNEVCFILRVELSVNFTKNEIHGSYIIESSRLAVFGLIDNVGWIETYR